MNSSQDPNLPHSVDGKERISRYLLREKLFDRKTRVVFAQAFKPPQATPEFPIRQTSVYRTQRLNEDDIWHVGDEYVTKLHAKQWPVLGRADIHADELFEVDLTIVPAPYPHPLHADIEGWPSEDELIELKLVSLSRKAALILRP